MPFCCGSATNVDEPESPPAREAAADPKGAAEAAAKPESMDTYTDPEDFREMLESGAVALLRGSFLVDLYDRGGRIERRQDMPAEAFWSADEAMAALTDKTPVPRAHLNNVIFEGTRGIYFLIALSYRWTEPGHPDKARHHLGALAQFVRLHRHWAKEEAGVEDTAVFWDFPCIYQRERTPEQSELFKKGLRSANIIYGHLYSFVVMQKSQPEGIPAPLDYSMSGWCQFESAVGSLCKWSAWYQDISVLASSHFNRFDLLIAACTSNTKRPVPVAPEHMRRVLEQARFTNGKSDQDQVARMYADIADTIFSQAEEVSLNNVPWTSEDVTRIAEVLPCYTKARYVCMWGTDVGRDGAAVLAPALRAMPSLEKVFFDCCIFGKETHAVLAGCLPPNLKLLQLSNLGGRGCMTTYTQHEKMQLADALAKWFRQPTSPQSINIAYMQGQFVTSVRDAWVAAGKPAEGLKLDA